MHANRCGKLITSLVHWRDNNESGEMMKTIGLLGGMSWESTIPYYRLINEGVKQRLGGLHSAQILLHSVDFHEIELCQSRGEWDKAGDILAQAALGLQQAGAEGIVLCTNTMHKVAEAIEAAKTLKEQGIAARVINICTIKPLDEEIVLKAAKECGKIVTVEEHSVIGGLGEAVCGLLSEKQPTPVKRIGVNDEFGHSGPAKELLKQFGLSAENIVKTVKEFI